MRIVLLAIVLFLQAKPTPPQLERPRENHQATTGDKKPAQQKQPDTSAHVGASPAPNNVANTAEQQPDTDKVEERRDRKAQLRLTRIYVKATVIGVIGSWIVLGVLVWQNILTRRSANAASLNARAVINSERPWVIVSLLRSKRNDRDWLSFRASNEGRSPAIILCSFAQYGFTGDPNSLPVPPQYGIELPKDVPLLVPNIGHDLSGHFIALYDYAFGEVMSNDRERARAIQNGGSHLVFWFKIVYTTHLAIEARLPPYETHYCCEYTPNAGEYLKIVGPAEYNRYS